MLNLHVYHPDQTQVCGQVGPAGRRSGPQLLLSGWRPGWEHLLNHVRLQGPKLSLPSDLCYHFPFLLLQNQLVLQSETWCVTLFTSHTKRVRDIGGCPWGLLGLITFHTNLNYDHLKYYDWKYLWNLTATLNWQSNGIPVITFFTPVSYSPAVQEEPEALLVHSAFLQKIRVKRICPRLQIRNKNETNEIKTCIISRLTDPLNCI